MKRQIRVLGIDDAPWTRGQQKTLLVGVFFRGGDFLDGVLSAPVAVDGGDSTEVMASMVRRSRFYPQIRAILLDGIAVAGFNIVDIHELHQKTCIPVIVVMRRLPRRNGMVAALQRLGMGDKVLLLEQAGKIHGIDNTLVQLAGCTAEQAREILRITCTHAHIPEPIRVAHLIASGVTYGESRGQA